MRSKTTLISNVHLKRLKTPKITCFDHTLDVSMTLGEVDGSQLSGSLAMLAVALEHRSVSFTLRSNAATHCCDCKLIDVISEISYKTI